MRIHANTLTRRDVHRAARAARVEFDRFNEHGSHKRDHAFDITLQGESRRRQNGGDGYAATWDQWGVFLSILFDLDSSLAIPSAYADRGEFDYRTGHRFNPPEATGTVDNFHSVKIGDAWFAHVDYWPTDAHGDHTFRFDGVPRQQSCTKCSATQTW